MRYQAARFGGILAMQIVSVAVAWQVYDLTRRPLDLGLVGLVQFVPLAVGWPITGTLIDRFERRGLIVALYGVHVLLALGLAGLATTGAGVPAILGALFVVGCARAMLAPASSATLPQLVPIEDFANAATWSSTLSSVATVAGPALGGAVYAWAGGAVSAFAVAAVLLAVAMYGMTRVTFRPIELSREPLGWAAAMAGLRFIRRTPVVLAAVTLDLFAVLFGGAVALLPIYARDIFHAGPDALGWLRAAPAVGAGAMAVFLAFRPLTRRVGRALLVTVAVFGVATIAFGFSTEFWPAMIALVVVGASDEVSVFIRQNIVQLATPGPLRGRVSAAEFVFIGASNELGEMESGFAAAWLGVVPAVVWGGVGSLAVVALAAIFARSLRRLDSFAELRPA